VNRKSALRDGFYLVEKQLHAASYFTFLDGIAFYQTVRKTPFAK
jgi:hypothetical protein